MNEFIQPLPKVSMENPKGKIKKVVLDLGRGDTMHVTLKVGNKTILTVEATPGNMLIERGVTGELSSTIHFYTRTLPK